MFSMNLKWTGSVAVVVVVLRRKKDAFWGQFKWIQDFFFDRRDWNKHIHKA